MPGPKRNAKLTGDTHPPELDDGALPPAEEDGGLARTLEDEAKPGKGENAAGFLKEKDSPHS